MLDLEKVREIKMNWFKKVWYRFKMRKIPWRHVTMVSQKDESGRYRYHMYIDGKLAKEEITFDCWSRCANEFSRVMANDMIEKKKCCK